MNLHEYQGKSILQSYGVAIQNGIVAENSNDAVKAAKKLTELTKTKWYVVKAQIHAGGRGKGGGVKLAKSLDEVKSISESIIGMKLITPQTPPEGKKVNKVLITEDVYYSGNSKQGSIIEKKNGNCSTVWSFSSFDFNLCGPV